MLALCISKGILFTFLSRRLLLEVVVCQTLFRIQIKVKLGFINVVALYKAHYLNVDIVPCLEELEHLLIDCFEVKVLDQVIFQVHIHVIHYLLGVTTVTNQFSSSNHLIGTQITSTILLFLQFFDSSRIFKKIEISNNCRLIVATSSEFMILKEG